mgnify:CR=1 FL=1
MGKNTSPALEALAHALAEKVKRSAVRPKPKLRVVTAAKPTAFDAITRDSILRRVRFLARSYRLQWLVDQHTFNVAGIDCLDDEAMPALLNDLERARECIADGVSFEDAGLLKSNVADLEGLL